MSGLARLPRRSSGPWTAGSTPSTMPPGRRASTSACSRRWVGRERPGRTTGSCTRRRNGSPVAARRIENQMQPVVIGDVTWEPTPEIIERSRLTRFMKSHGIAGLAQLQERSIADQEWFWDAVVHDLGIRWYRAYDRVLDLSEGVMWPHWLGGGKLNIVDTCLDQWVRGPRAQPEKTALILEGEPGEVRRLTFAELDLQVCRLGAALEKLG